MAKTLELQFITEGDKTATISIDNPKEPANVAEIQAAMAQIIASGVFTTSSGSFTGVKGARLVERNVSDYEVI